VKTALLQQVLREIPKPSLLASLRAWLFAPGMTMRVAVMAVIVVLVASNVLLWTQVNQLSQMNKHGYASVLLDSTDNNPEKTGMVVYTSDGRYGFLVVNGLDTLDESQQYQLWLIKDGERTSGGIFSVGRSGYHVLEIKSKIRLDTYDGFGITIEPAGGSPGPTGDRVLDGSF
jgi:anti-sigma-K factor RskA